jgi:hypothetical protein
MPSEVMAPLTADMDSNAFAQKAADRFSKLKHDKTSSLYL